MSDLEQSSNIRCPKCSSPMKQVTVNDVTVDRCTSCQGIWFDLMEHRHLREASGAASVDIGPAAKGEDLQSKVKMTCPRCKVAMSRLRDVDQRDIIYEYCSICSGVFFDAGEFRHYAEHSFVGRIRSWFTLK